MYVMEIMMQPSVSFAEIIPSSEPNIPPTSSHDGACSSGGNTKHTNKNT